MMLEQFQNTPDDKMLFALKTVYSALTQLNSFNAWYEESLCYRSMLKLLDGPKERLLAIFNSDATQECKDLSFRIYWVLAFLMESNEDILFIYNIIRERFLTINLFREIGLCKTLRKVLSPDENSNEENEEKSDSNHSEFDYFEYDLEEDLFFDYNIKDLSKLEVDLSQIDSMAFDKKFIYCIHTSYGLVKVGKVDADAIEKGKIYSQHPKWAGTKFTIFYLNSYLYLRPYLSKEWKLPTELEEFSEYPFIILNVNDLETPWNNKFSELLWSTKRDILKDDWNKPILENINYKTVTEENKIPEHEEYRVLPDIPFGSDGKYIYAVAYYIKDINNLRSRLVKVVIERYCPITWKLLKEIPCNLTLEKSKNLEDSEDDDEDDERFKYNTKIVDSIMNLPLSIKVQDLAINSDYLCMVSDGNLLWFSLKKPHR
jgi:hypothetical protein